MVRYSQAAEEALVADLILLPHHIGEVVEQVAEEDFYRPACRHLFATLRNLWAEGEHIDTVTLVRRLEERGLLDQVGGTRGVVDVSGQATGGFRSHVRTVTADALSRRLAHAARAIAALADDGSIHAADALELAKLELAGIDVPLGQPPRDLHMVDEFMDRPVEQRQPWVVPGLLRRGWRVMVIASEGSGKSTVLRQCSVLIAQGVHPFAFTPIPPVRTLLVDLENPDDAITGSCIKLRAQLRRTVDYEPGRAWLWHRPAGIDLRGRTGRAELEAAVAATQPDLVCLGPLYKAYRVSAREADEQAAGEVQHVLDDLRTRYGFALVIEHHAPKAQGGRREMTPYGSSLWLRWPEQGIKLAVDRVEGQAKNFRLAVDRWRGDRLPAAWPDALERGKEWPWVGVWKNPADRNWTEPEDELL